MKKTVLIILITLGFFVVSLPTFALDLVPGGSVRVSTGASSGDPADAPQAVDAIPFPGDSSLDARRGGEL